MSHYSDAVNRINRIDSKPYSEMKGKRYDEVRSKGDYAADATLIAEYYRRVGVLLQELYKGGEAGISIRSMLSRAVDQEFEGLDYEALPTICPNLEEIQVSSLMKFICFGYLEWCSLLDQGHPIALKHSDIYEPIIKLFERGGGQINIHHHELVGGFGAFPRNISADRGSRDEFDIRDSALDQRVKEGNGGIERS